MDTTILDAVADMLPNASVECNCIFHPSDLDDCGWMFGPENGQWHGTLTSIDDGDILADAILCDADGRPIAADSTDADAISDAILAAIGNEERRRR